MSNTDNVASSSYFCRHLAKEWMLMTAMDARMHKASLRYISNQLNDDTQLCEHRIQTLCALITWLYLFKVMEESRQRSRSFTAERTSLPWGPQTVSSPRRIALSVVSCHFGLSFWPQGQQKIKNKKSCSAVNWSPPPTRLLSLHSKLH